MNVNNVLLLNHLYLILIREAWLRFSLILHHIHILDTSLSFTFSRLRELSVDQALYWPSYGAEFMVLWFWLMTSYIPNVYRLSLMVPIVNPQDRLLSSTFLGLKIVINILSMCRSNLVILINITFTDFIFLFASYLSS